MCLYPRLIKNRKYTSNKKNGGNIPTVPDVRVLLVPVGCGNCMECRKQKRRGWQIRLLEEVKHKKDGHFITLTFSNKNIKELAKECKELSGYNIDNRIATIAMRRFLERWRKKYKISLRHWMVTELGGKGTQNIHMHGIIWCNKEELKTLDGIWKYGHVWKGHEINGKIENYVNEKTVNYITKYVSKMDDKHKNYKSKVLTSPGIGRNYTSTYNSKLNKYQGDKTIESYRTNTGFKISMPVYWRNKIYSEDEREKLWLQRLDKQERWVCGEKISIKNGYEQYDNIVKHYRIINKRLGYGDNEKNWEQIRYEQQRRTLMIKERIKMAWAN